MRSVLTFAAAVLFAGTVAAHDILTPEIDRSREAAAKYWNIAAALEDGYQQLFGCITHGGHGAMGIHFIHPDRLNDGRLVLEEPEALMYEPRPDGTMQLVAIEYIVREKNWDRPAAPVFMGQRMRRKTSVGPHPVDPFYEVHVWHWRHNPAGLFSDWNPAVTCEHAAREIDAAGAP